jgi:hypothetical protein
MRHIALGLICLLALNACTSNIVRPVLPMGAEDNGEARDLRWYSSCFRMPFDANGEPVWATDLMIADRILAPILQVHAPHLKLWRFHRRAAQDRGGHQFSVLVYVSPSAYAEIRNAIDSASTVEDLKALGRLSEVVHDCRGETQAYGIDATSDRSWDPTLQRAWPYFIMGVSASWLALVQTLALETGADEQLSIQRYAEIEARITALWGQQGQHAFLHHLSGIYGYQPLLIQKWLQF